MKKFLGILVAVILCVCLAAPSCFATSTIDTDSLLSKLDGVDIGDLNAGEIAEILGVDISELGNVVEALKNTGSSSDAVDYVIKSLSADGSAASSETTTAAAASSGDSALSGISDMLGGIDLSSIASSDMLSSLTGLFEGVDLSSFDVSSLMDTISGAFSGSGIDLSSMTGSFDIGSLLGGLGGGSSSGDASSDGSSSGSSAGSGVMDTMASLMDSLMGGLGSLGLDTSALDGLKDSEVVNFFANLYQGLGQVEEEETTTKAPDVVTTATPKTGDTSAVVAAIATLSVASAAAFVCLKGKKKNEA
ncbi:MAG: LPXTG cell wall anchor domain-containing protein [Acutalibacteraceae bacterium]